MLQQVRGGHWNVVAAGDANPAGEPSPHADLVAGACRVQKSLDDTLGPAADAAESAEKSERPHQPLIGQQEFR
jgi:hypothetical protein